jgi:hypothetical protein
MSSKKNIYLFMEYVKGVNLIDRMRYCADVLKYNLQQVADRANLDDYLTYIEGLPIYSRLDNDF